MKILISLPVLKVQAAANVWRKHGAKDEPNGHDEANDHGHDRIMRKTLHSLSRNHSSSPLPGAVGVIKDNDKDESDRNINDDGNLHGKDVSTLEAALRQVHRENTMLRLKLVATGQSSGTSVASRLSRSEDKLLDLLVQVQSRWPVLKKRI